jgi:hypothetical protein
MGLSLDWERRLSMGSDGIGCIDEGLFAGEPSLRATRIV